MTAAERAQLLVDMGVGHSDSYSDDDQMDDAGRIARAIEAHSEELQERIDRGNAVFEESGFQFCPIVSAHSPGPKSSKK